MKNGFRWKGLIRNVLSSPFSFIPPKEFRRFKLTLSPVFIALFRASGEENWQLCHATYCVFGGQFADGAINCKGRSIMGTECIYIHNMWFNKCSFVFLQLCAWVYMSCLLSLLLINIGEEIRFGKYKKRLLLLDKMCIFED